MARALVYSELLLQIILIRKQSLEILVKSLVILVNLGKILVTMNLSLKFNEAEGFCHLLKINSIRGLLRNLSKFYTIRYGLF